MPKFPFHKPVRHGKSKLAFAKKRQAERQWDLGKSYDRKGNSDAGDNCRSLAFETAKEADAIANSK